MATTALWGTVDSTWSNILYGEDALKLLPACIDVLVPTDEATASGKHISIAASTIVITEAVVGKAHREVVDTVVLTDSTTSKSIHFVSDTLAATDKLELVGRIYGNAKDLIVAQDTVKASKKQALSAHDTLGPITDQVKTIYAKHGVAHDLLTPTEHLSGEVKFASAHDILTGSVTVVYARARLQHSGDVVIVGDVAAKGPSIVNPRASDATALLDLAQTGIPVDGFRLSSDPGGKVNLFVLPEPEFNNLEHSINRIQIYRAEQGRTYTYVQRTTKVRVYTFSFVIPYMIFRNLESYLYVQGQKPASKLPQANLNLYIAYRADLYRVKLTTTTPTAVNVNQDLYRTVLDFEGVRVRYGGGRALTCA